MDTILPIARRERDEYEKQFIDWVQTLHADYQVLLLSPPLLLSVSSDLCFMT